MLTAERLRDVLVYDPATGLFRWRASRSQKLAGCLSYGYVAIRIDKARYQAHRLAFLYMVGRWPAYDIDHKNGVRNDNSWVNLREATRSQNLANMKLKPASTTGIKGVSFDKARGKYAAKIRDNYKTVNLGRFDSPEEAHNAYVAAARLLYGEFARAG